MDWLTFVLIIAVIAGPLVVAEKEKAAVAVSFMLASSALGLVWGARLSGAGAMTSVQIVIFTVTMSVVTVIAFAILTRESQQESHGESHGHEPASVRHARHARRKSK